METITLGRRTDIPVVAQKHAKLRNRLSRKDFEGLMSGDYGTESYRLLCVLIPYIDPQSKQNKALPEGGGIPLWEWEGYASQEAMEAGEYDEELDNSPDTAQIVHAFETALMVAGAGRLGKIISLVEGVTTMVSLQTQTPTPPLPDSLGVNGE